MLNQLFSGNISPESAYFWVVGLLLAITFHEAAHAWVATLLGDLTAKYMGRLTLNPLAHLDPIGTVLILFAGFGWGRPVQFNPLSLKNPAFGGALISLAGPVSNLLVALAFSLLIRAQVPPLNLWAQIAAINIMLAIFNLLPFSPLDGEKVVGGFLPHNLRSSWASLQNYGIFYLIIFIMIGGPLLTQVIGLIFNLFTGQGLI